MNGHRAMTALVRRGQTARPLEAFKERKERSGIVGKEVWKATELMETICLQ